MRTMKPRLALLVLVLALAGCAGPLSLYYKPGASVARMQTDTTQCQVAALKDAPVASQVRQRPPIWIPGNRYCNANGCWVTPGYWVDGGIYTVDVNAPLRNRVQDLCMAQKGYQPVRLPRCTPAVANAVQPGLTTVLPTLAADSCVIDRGGGRWQIVTPSAPAAE